MEDRMKMRLIVTAFTALAVAACGQSAEQKAAQQTSQQAAQTAQTSAQQAQQAQQGAQQAQQGAQQAGQQLAQGLQQMAQGLQQMGQKDASGKPIPPIDFEKLEALLPAAPAGWTKGKTRGQQTTVVVSTSNAEVTYTKGDMNVHLEITDSALNQMLLAPMSFMLAAGYSERSSSGYKKSMTMGGSPGYEEWNSEDKNGETTVVVANRFIIAGKGRNLDSIDSLRGIVDKVDIAKLAAVK
jgi:type II secretory pathway pseudopilin PulG